MDINLQVPEEILHHLLDPVSIPPMARVRHRMRTPLPIEDLAAALHEQMAVSRMREGIRPGARIAIGVGSRGIDRLDEVVAALVRDLRALGAEPFIVPTMGSHGGATAAGQREVLAHLGVTPERMGAPFESQIDRKSTRLNSSHA